MPTMCSRYQYCSRVGTNVRVCRSEAECRREYCCTEPNCPLETAFGLEAFDARIACLRDNVRPLASGRRQSAGFPLTSAIVSFQSARRPHQHHR